MGMDGRTAQQLVAWFRRWAATPSVIALVLVVAGSLATLPVAGWPSILLIPIAVAAVPVVVPRLWIRLLAAFLLTLWTFSTMGAWTFYLPGWLAALFAATRPDTIGGSDTAPRMRRVVTVPLVVLLVPLLGLLVVRYGLLRPPDGWEFFTHYPYALRDRHIDVVYGKRTNGGCESHHLLQQAGDQPLLQARMLGIDHRDCTILMEVGVPAR